MVALAAAGCSSRSGAASSSSAGAVSSSSSSGTSTGSGSTAKGAPFLVGALGTFSGVASGSTADAKTVFQDWVDATNAAGGINGHPVQAYILDDQNSPSTALTNAEQLVQQDHVQVIFDLSENQESAWAKVVDTAKVPVLGQSESPVLGTDPNFYSTGTTVEPLIWGELKAASIAKVTKIGALYCAEIASCAQTVPLIDELGKTVSISLAYSAKISSTASSYTAQCLGAKNSGAQGVTVGAASDVALSVAQSCAAQGYKPTYVSTAGEMTTPWLAQSALNGAIGTTQDAPWFDDSIPATKAMQAAISRYSPSVPSSSTFGATAVIGWAAGTVFATVAKTANLTPNSSQTAIIAALDTVKNDTFGGLTPPLTYTAGKPAQVPCSFIAGISNGKWTEPIGLKTVCQPAA
ncbi:MAG TPA: ABC transporter substrate-binding protein [Trebonia sp.]|jgi:branched-chain amino acid transport system substrate-binding protein